MLARYRPQFSWWVGRVSDRPLTGAFGFHIGTQPASPGSTQEPLPVGHLGLIGCIRCCWVLLGVKNRRTENPRVGGSIPPLATNSNLAD